MSSEYLNKLEDKIQSAFEDGVTMEAAERLAAEFLHAQMKVSGELKKRDLDARMRKTGVKAVRAAAYGQIIASNEKKPTEGAIEHAINLDGSVRQEQDALDLAEVERDELKRYYDVFENAHIFFRGVAKGQFNG